MNTVACVTGVSSRRNGVRDRVILQRIILVIRVADLIVCAGDFLLLRHGPVDVVIVRTRGIIVVTSSTWGWLG
jgi:hypothetical protein